MKKVVGGLAVSLVLLIGATACGGGDDAESGTSPTTAEATGGGGESEGTSSVEEFCAAADEVVAAVKAKDAERVKAAGVKFRETTARVNEEIRSNPTDMAKYTACSQKGALALAGRVDEP